MAIARMQKVAVLAHRSHKEEILQTLQEAGVLEIGEAKEPLQTDHTEVNFRAAELQFAIETLKSFASKETNNAMNKPATPGEIIAAASHTDVRGIIDSLHGLEESDTGIERKLTELQSRKQLFAPWTGLQERLDNDAETHSTIRILGTLSEGKRTEFEQEAAERFPRTVLEHVGDTSGQSYMCAIVWKADRMGFEELATTKGWSTIQLPRHTGTAALVYEEALLEEASLLAQKEKNKEARARLAIELPKLLRVKTFLQWLSDKQSAREALTETFATVTLLGWMPVEEQVTLEKKLTAISPAVALLKVKPDEGEEPPVLLKNPKFIKPFESVTTLYGLPLFSEMDPTAPLSPFFALYFALCLTDGGYGLVLTVIFGTYLLVTKKSIESARLEWLLFISGIASILVGIPFGGWFGLSPAQVPEFLTMTDANGVQWFRGQFWNLSTETGIQFLQNLALFLGITHLFFGMFLAGYFKWIHGQRASAFWEHFTSHILLGGVLFYVFAPANLKDISLYTLYVTAAMFVWGKGFGTVWYLRPLMGFLGAANFAIGLLSNGLSYLRLLALGLVTGAIALAVNQVAIEMSKLFPIWLGIPVMILIAVGGHLVSIALNSLGSFIHSGRLQFIEFFSQFFEGGGRPFNPFKRSNS